MEGLGGFHLGVQGCQMTKGVLSGPKPAILPASGSHQLTMQIFLCPTCNLPTFFSIPPSTDSLGGYLGLLPGSTLRISILQLHVCP